MRPTNAQLEKINTFVIEGKLYADNVEVYKSYLVDNEVTGHYTKFSNQAKQAYANNLDEGKVPLMFIHNKYGSLPVGRSFGYEYSDGVLYGWFYIVKDSNVKSGDETTNTNDVIKNINTGTYQATSVGIDGNVSDWKCNICGKEYYMSGECVHIAGVKYEEGLCVIDITNNAGEAVLLENSIVFNGAVKKAGFVSVPVAEGYELPVACSHSKLGHVTEFSHKGEKIRVINKQELKMADGKILKEDSKMEFTKEEFVDLYAENKLLSKDVESYKTKVSDLEKENTELRKAKDNYNDEAGKAEAQLSEYAKTEEAVSEIVKELGVKAYGNDFNVEEFEALSYTDKVSKIEEYTEALITNLPSGVQSPEGTSNKAPQFVSVDAYRLG